jgi:hypothetical protein
LARGQNPKTKKNHIYCTTITIYKNIQVKKPLARRLKKTLYVVLFTYYKQLVNVGPLKKIPKGSRPGGEEARPELW